MKKYAVLLILALSLLLVQVAGAELVFNGDFKTGDLSGWSYSGDPNFVEFGTDTPHSGKYYAYFGEVGKLGFLSQSITTTQDESYNVSFWLWSDGSTPNQFQAKWDGLELVNLVDIPLGGYPIKDKYTQYQFTVVGGAGSCTLLEFGMRNDPWFTYLDDISVNPVPIPGAVWLLGSGLVGLAGLRRKFKG